MTNESALQSQSQEQTQQQSLILNVDLRNSGDPAFERYILNEKHSVGRQLARLSAVVEVLLAAHRGDPNFAQQKEEQEVLKSFESMRAEIEREKQRSDPGSIIEQLEQLRSDDPEAFAGLKQRLRAWLDGTESGV